MHHNARRLIDLTEADLADLIDSRLAGLSSTAEPIDPQEGMPRAKTGKLLNVSLSQLDILSRRDREDPIPYYLVGESRRYIRADVVAWLRRQKAVAA